MSTKNVKKDERDADLRQSLMRVRQLVVHGDLPTRFTASLIKRLPATRIADDDVADMLEYGSRTGLIQGAVKSSKVGARQRVFWFRYGAGAPTDPERPGEYVSAQTADPAAGPKRCPLHLDSRSWRVVQEDGARGLWACEDCAPPPPLRDSGISIEFARVADQADWIIDGEHRRLETLKGEAVIHCFDVIGHGTAGAWHDFQDHQMSVFHDWQRHSKLPEMFWCAACSRRWGMAEDDPRGFARLLVDGESGEIKLLPRKQSMVPTDALGNPIRPGY